MISTEKLPKKMKRVGDWVVPVEESLMIKTLQEGGSWQSHHLSSLVEKAIPERQRGVAVDCGAHIGCWSRELRNLGFSRVLAFEPNEDAYDCLKLNVGSDPFIEIYPLALGNKYSTCAVKPDDRLGSGNTGGCWVDPGAGNCYMTVLDDYFFARLDLLKIDAEGYEPFVLKGARKHIERFAPHIIIEYKPKFGSRWNNWEDPKIVLDRMGYNLLYRIGSDQIWRKR